MESGMDRQIRKTVPDRGRNSDEAERTKSFPQPHGLA
jgi:hypothetical protein